MKSLVQFIQEKLVIKKSNNLFGYKYSPDTNEELKDLAKIEEKITVEVDSISAEILEKIKEFKTVEEVSLNKNTLLVTYKKGNNNLKKLIDFLEENKITYNKIFSERPTLNDVFLELTGKGLRD